jgi:hypothetical protein
MSEYDNDEKYSAPGFIDPDGKPACLLSSANPKTVDRHFAWMQRYGIDGLQGEQHPADARPLRDLRGAAGRLVPAADR